MVKGEADWFSAQGSPVKWLRDIRVGDLYRVAWLEVDAPAEAEAGEAATFPVTVRNEGALTWTPSGDNPVNLTYKWLDADTEEVVADGLRTSLSREVEPLEEITMDARVQFPAQPGAYILQIDMVHEMVTWFQQKGSSPYEVQVEVEPVPLDYAAEWLDYVGPQRLIVGQVGSAYVKVKNVGDRN